MSGTIATLSPGLVALKPRQVLLSQHKMKQRNVSETTLSLAASANQSIVLEPEQRILLHHAVALYLEGYGFSKTLKKFRSEAQIEKNSSNGCLLNLEEMCYTYLNKWLDKSNQANSSGNKQETVKEVDDDKVPESQEEPTKKHKHKKIVKAKVASNSDADSVEKEQSRSLHVDSLVNSKDTEPSEIYTVCEEEGKKSKDKKKKKNKHKLESICDDLENDQIAVAINSEDANVSKDSQAGNSNSLDGNIVPDEEKVVKSKTKKKKDGQNTKKKKDGQNLSDEHSKQLPEGSFNGTGNENCDVEMVRENDCNENSKKRKRLPVVERNSQHVDEKETEDSKRRKIQGSKVSNDDARSTKVNASVETAAESRGASNQHHENRNVEETGEKTPEKKELNGSAEPKTVNAFQRVKLDDVVFSDERLTDNSYWAKGGADIGYGAKAQEVLGQVKGRDFRHEKTKKKRGSYRGGVIDLQSHSVKFNYSDED